LYSLYAWLLLLLLLYTINVVEGVAAAGKATCAKSALWQIAASVITPPVLVQVAVIAYLAGEDSAATSVNTPVILY